MKKIIIVTDGDETAQSAVEKSSERLGLRVISKSGGNPTPCSGKSLLNMIQECPTDPIVVMFDDEGNFGCGDGERALKIVANSSEVEILGVLAVASNAKEVTGIRPNCSISKEGEIVEGPVDKQGQPEADGHTILEGDTVDIINDIDKTLVIGIGDIGKMSGKDNAECGAPITTKAIQEILKRSDINYEKGCENK